MSSIRSFSKFEKIGDYIYNVEYMECGIILIDYPNELLCKEITEEGKENIKKAQAMFDEFKKKKNLIIKLGDSITPYKEDNE